MVEVRNSLCSRDLWWNCRHLSAICIWQPVREVYIFFSIFLRLLWKLSRESVRMNVYLAVWEIRTLSRHVSVAHLNKSVPWFMIVGADFWSSAEIWIDLHYLRLDLILFLRRRANKKTSVVLFWPASPSSFNYGSVWVEGHCSTHSNYDSDCDINKLSSYE